MKKRIFQIMPLLVIWAIVIACGIPNPLSPAVTQTPYVITATSQPVGDTPVIVENTAESNGSGELLPTAEMSEPTATMAQAQVTQPSSGNQVSNGPAGVLIYEDVDGMVGVYDSYGNKLGNVNTPDFSGYGPGRIYAYDLDVNNIAGLQTYYFSSQGQMLKMVANGQTSDLVAIDFFANMAAFATSPYFLVGKGSFADGGLATEIMAYNFIGNMETRYYMDTVSAESHVYSAMTITGNNGVPDTAYCTMEAYGIGGDIVYPVTFGLYRMDLASGNVNWLFNDDYRPLSISADGSLAAIVQRNASGPQGVTIYNLSGPSEIVTYDLLMGQDRGAGYAVFSPDNQKVVFMQAGGYMMAQTPDFHSMLCYADVAPAAVANCLPATQLVVSSVAYPNSTAQPLGWLNNHEVLFEAYTLQEPQHTLRVIDVDTGNVRDFASGKFLTFIY